MSKENTKTDYYGFRWYAKDFVTSVAVVSMSLAARGAYITLLSYQGLEESCTLPNNDKVLSRLCGCDMSEWLEIKDEVLSRFETNGDRIYNERLMNERSKIDATIAVRSEAGKRSAEARSKKALERNPTNAQQVLNTCSTKAEQNANYPGTRNQEPGTNNHKKEEEGAAKPKMKTEDGETPSAGAPALPVKTSVPGAIEIYRELFKRYPAKKISPAQLKQGQTETDHDLIVNTVDEAEPEIWRNACTEWRDTAAARKHNPLNVEAVIDFYAKALLGEEIAPQGNVKQNYGIQGDLR